MNRSTNALLDSGIRLMPANPADAGDIESMARQIWPTAYGGIIPDDQIEFMLHWMYSASKLIAEMTEDGITYDWILSDAIRAGFIATGPSRDEEAVSQLHKFYLLPERQGQGIGSIAMQLLIDRLIQSGVSRLDLRVNRNNTSALAFYRKNHFEVHAGDCLDIGSGFVMDDFLLRRLISEEPGTLKPGETIR